VIPVVVGSSPISHPKELSKKPSPRTGLFAFQPVVTESLLDIESEQQDDHPPSSEQQPAIMNELIKAVAVIQSNYATKEELAVVNGKLDVIISLQHTYATKAELSNAVYQLTWRMAGFAIAIIGAVVTSIRYL
jgi:hypothetical protein